MKSYLLDTNAVADCIFRRRGVNERAKQARRQGARIGTCLPVVAELLAGVEYSSTRDANLKIVDRNLKMFKLWPFDLAAARVYARLYADLRRKGRPMQPIDMMAAAIALSFANCTVVSSDGDLNAVPGLTVENWAV